MDSNLDSMFIESELIVPVSIEFRDDLSPEDFGQLCRLCGNSNPQLMPIFSDDGDEHKLSDKIKEHLPIIEISRNDILPLSICYQCVSTLISWHELYYACKDADLRLKQICSRLKLEKFESEENLMEVHDDVDYTDDIDSYERVEELPNEICMSPKPEVFLPHPVIAETTPEKFDSFKDVAFVESSNPIEECMAVDNEVRKPSVEEIGKPSVEEIRKPPVDEIKIRSPPSPDMFSAEIEWSSSEGDEDDDEEELEESLKDESLPPESKATAASRHADAAASDPSILSSATLPRSRTDPSGRYQCYKCDRRFANRVHLNMHYNEGRVVFANPAVFHELYELMRLQPLVPPDRIDRRLQFECAQCAQRFPTKGELRTHIHCYHPSVPKFRCDFCAARFVTECDLAEHRVAHSAERRLICGRCGRRRQTGSLAYETNRERIAFEMCGCASTARRRGPAAAHRQSAAAAAAHGLRRRRRDPDEREREAREREERRRKRQEALDTLGKVCTECGKEFATRLSLKRHYRLHKNPSECAICGKWYGRAYMKNHLLIHSQEKTYVCQKCGKGFAQLSSLRSHQLLEENVRKFVCNVCGARFVLSSRFHSHMKTHLAELPFKCDDCGRGYGYVWQLRQHQVRHSDVRPYACEQCGRAYKTMKHLRQHYVVHTRELAG